MLVYERIQFGKFEQALYPLLFLTGCNVFLTFIIASKHATMSVKMNRNLLTKQGISKEDLDENDMLKRWTRASPSIALSEIKKSVIRKEIFVDWFTIRSINPIFPQVRERMLAPESLAEAASASLKAP